MKQFSFGLFFACYVFSSWVYAENGQLVIKLIEKSTVVGPEISLGDVSEIIGNNKTLVEKFRRISIGKASPAGSALKITKGYIRIVLRREGYNLEEVAFQGPESSQVLSQSQVLTPMSFLPEIKAFVLKQIGDSPQNVEIKILGGEKKIILPAGKVKANFRPSFSGKYEGSFLLTTELDVNGHLARVLPLRIETEIFHLVVVTKKAVEKGDKFTSANVALVRVPTSKIIPGCLQKTESVLGRTASYALPSGALLRLSEINDPPVIRRGQLIQAIVQKGNIELSIEARALVDGKAGDSIQVVNTDSGKVLHGKVLDEKSVLIDEKQ